MKFKPLDSYYGGDRRMTIVRVLVAALRMLFTTITCQSRLQSPSSLTATLKVLTGSKAAKRTKIIYSKEKHSTREMRDEFDCSLDQTDILRRCASSTTGTIYSLPKTTLSYWMPGVEYMSLAIAPIKRVPLAIHDIIRQLSQELENMAGTTDIRMKPAIILQIVLAALIHCAELGSILPEDVIYGLSYFCLAHDSRTTSVMKAAIEKYFFDPAPKSLIEIGRWVEDAFGVTHAEDCDGDDKPADGGADTVHDAGRPPTKDGELMRDDLPVKEVSAVVAHHPADQRVIHRAVPLVFTDDMVEEDPAAIFGWTTDQAAHYKQQHVEEVERQKRLADQKAAIIAQQKEEALEPVRTVAAPKGRKKRVVVPAEPDALAQAVEDAPDEDVVPAVRRGARIRVVPDRLVAGEPPAKKTKDQKEKKEPKNALKKTGKK